MTENPCLSQPERLGETSMSQLSGQKSLDQPKPSNTMSQNTIPDIDTPKGTETKNTNLDTLQEVGQWMIENDQILSELEDAIMAADPNDTSTQEFLLIHHELGNVTGMLRAAVLAAQPAIERIEALKAKYGI